MPRDARSEDSRKLGIAVELYATQMSIVPRAQKLARLSINAPTVKTRLSVRQIRDAMSCHHNRTAPASALLRPMLRVSIRKSTRADIARKALRLNIVIGSSSAESTQKSVGIACGTPYGTVRLCAFSFRVRAHLQLREPGERQFAAKPIRSLNTGYKVQEGTESTRWSRNLRHYLVHGVRVLSRVGFSNLLCVTFTIPLG